MAERTPEEIQAQMRIHLHNGLLGPVGMMLGLIDRINVAETTTQEAKEFALNMKPDLQKLTELLRVRVDPSK